MMSHANRASTRRRRARIRRYRRVLVEAGEGFPPRRKGERMASYEDRLFDAVADLWRVRTWRTGIR